MENLVSNGTRTENHNITAMVGEDNMTGELLETCRDCKDNVIYAQDDLDEIAEKMKGVGE